MNIVNLIIGIFLIVWGIYSLRSSYKKKNRITGVMMPSDTYLSEKILGERGSNIFWNYFWGVIKLFMGIVLIWFI
jgi:uncharacterized membrane protein HdeD (DUF308 family)